MKRACALLLLAGLTSVARDPGWIHLTTPNFEIYTTDTESAARQTLETFEQVRGFFQTIKATNVTTRLPVTVVGFRNPKEFQPYRSSEVAAAFYVGDEQHDYIVMSDLGAEHTPTAIHEYVHLLVRHSGIKMPLWLNEGFAEVYSTLKPMGNQIVVGTVPQGRARRLGETKWLPLATLTAVDHDSAEYNRKEHVGIFYAQSWLLAHMLMLNPKYSPQFPRFVAQLSEGASSAEAFQAVYGKDFQAIDRELNAYYRSSTLNGLAFQTRFDKTLVGRATAAPDLDTGLTLARVSALTGHKEAAASRLAELADRYKDRFEVEEALAYLAWANNDTAKALGHLEAALAKGTKSWKSHWDYTRLLQADDPEADNLLDLVRKTLALNPDILEARILLADQLYHHKQYAESLTELQRIRQVDPDHAYSVFLLTGYCALQLEQTVDARKQAELALKYARTPAEKENAERLIGYTEPRKPRAQPALRAQSEERRPRREPPPDAEDDQPPTMKRPDPPSPDPPPALEPPPPPEPEYPSVTGRLVRLDCLGAVARMHIAAGQASYALLIRNPTEVRINAGTGSTMLTCGAQNRAVTVHYDPTPDKKQQTSGDVRAIEFH